MGLGRTCHYDSGCLARHEARALRERPRLMPRGGGRLRLLGADYYLAVGYVLVI
jgi:hypothetical protein